jgi:CHAT domain-containing protein
LEYVRKRAAELSATKTKDKNSLLISMPTTSDRKPLKFAEQEISGVADKLRSSGHSTVLLKPNKTDVVRELPSCNIAHFACHGVADVKDPSRSKLLLEDWKQKPFDVRTLLRTPIRKCSLAYLSACETASNKALSLGDESLHFAGGFLMAGVPHCVATWWSIEDETSSTLAERFYGHLMNGDGEIQFERTAYVLHQSIQSLRDDGVDPLFWAAYCHYGP